MGPDPIIIPIMGMILGLICVLVLLIGLPWLILHYIVQWRKAGSLKVEDERMLEDVWRAAHTMERRIEALEAILEAQAPGWRRPRESE
jgi:phage shock protein B